MRKSGKNIGLSFSNFKLSTKISIMYIFFFALSVLAIFLICTSFSYRLSIQKNTELSMQTLYSIKSNIYNKLEMVSYISRSIIGNNTIRDVISDEQSILRSDSQRVVSSHLIASMNTVSYIDSIYIYDNLGIRYGVDNNSMKTLRIGRIEYAEWYKEVNSQKGYYKIILNADDIFYEKENERNLSLVRIVNDTNTQRQIGTLLMNFSGDALRNTYQEIVEKYNTNILLVDENNQTIDKNDKLPDEEVQDILGLKFKGSESSIIHKQGKTNYLYTSMDLEEYNWRIFIGIPMSQMVSELQMIRMIFLLVILFMGILFSLSIIAISRMITKPIHHLIHSMKQVEKGSFIEVDVVTRKDEIGQLKDNYNIMVRQIQNLIQGIIKEQKIKRKAELKVMQEQMKPHFLYNTLDALGYLALTGKKEEIYDAIEALGSYYKKSLSKGREIITVQEELNIVKDYLYLLKLRYGDIFEAEYDIDEKTLPYQTLKLILQPVVENCIYHGIKPKGEPGRIKVSSKLEGNHILFMIEDDGIGIGKEELENLLGEKLDKNMKSFGLRGTIERLKTYYERNDLYNIESHINLGTKVSIRIPINSVQT